MRLITPHKDLFKFLFFNYSFITGELKQFTVKVLRICKIIYFVQKLKKNVIIKKNTTVGKCS